MKRGIASVSFMESTVTDKRRMVGLGAAARQYLPTVMGVKRTIVLAVGPRVIVTALAV